MQIKQQEWQLIITALKKQREECSEELLDFIECSKKMPEGTLAKHYANDAEQKAFIKLSAIDQLIAKIIIHEIF